MQDALIWSVGILGFLAVGVTLLVYDAKQVRMLTRSLEWPQVQGKVRSAKVFQHKGEGGGSYAEFKYTYEVDGVGYESDRVHFGDVAASDMVLKYRIGHDVSVYYDPDDPSISVLERKLVGHIKYAIVGVAAIGLASLAIYAVILQFFS